MHKISLSLFLLLCLTINPLIGWPQTCGSINSHYNHFESADSSKLYLRIENFNFIKNNEYKGDFADGTTWMGYLVSPKLTYYPTSKVRIEAGVRFQKYSGLTDYSEVEPVLSAHYQPNANTSVIFGSLDQDNNHQLTEPLFEPERFFSDPKENGVQFLLDYDRFRFDTWINWEQFIFQNDPFQERFTFGASSQWHLNTSESSNSWMVPIQVLITHRGGEIDSSDDPVQTLANFSTGLTFSHKTQGTTIDSWGVETMGYFFKDNSGTKKFAFDKGFAFYPSAYITTNHSKFHLGYYNAYRFIAPKGSHLFQSVSSNTDGYAEDRRELITGKYIYNRKLGKGICFGGKLDLYLDPRNGTLQYATGIYLTFNQNFFLKKIPLR